MAATMKGLKKMTEQELDALVQIDNPYALVEKGIRVSKLSDKAEAIKYFTLASVLGLSRAYLELAKLFEQSGNLEDAYEHYALAYEKGDDSAVVPLARIILAKDRELGLEVLQDNAESGNRACIKELISISKKANDPDKVTYWQSKLTPRGE